jgi:hypothetical protein
MKKPFYERFWWLPSAINLVAIVISVVVLGRHCGWF